MGTTHENEILFDDLSILTQLKGDKRLNILSQSNDCDCSSYTSIPNQNDFDTDQITPSIGQTNR